MKKGLFFGLAVGSIGTFIALRNKQISKMIKK